MKSIDITYKILSWFAGLAQGDIRNQSNWQNHINGFTGQTNLNFHLICSIMKDKVARRPFSVKRKWLNKKSEKKFWSLGRKI
jgi:hypothetical protein